jgi:hypothetical protein
MARAKFLERELKLAPNPRAKVDAKVSTSAFRGQFLERPPRGKKLFRVITLGHDNGLALIYGSVLGAWFFPLIVSFLGGLGYPRTLRFSIGVASATAMVSIFIVALLLLDPGRRRSASTDEETKQTPSGPEAAANTADRADGNRKQRGSRHSSA